jgi:hypothetical protein
VYPEVVTKELGKGRWMRKDIIRNIGAKMWLTIQQELTSPMIYRSYIPGYI